MSYLNNPRGYIYNRFKKRNNRRKKTLVIGHNRKPPYRRNDYNYNKGRKRFPRKKLNSDVHIMEKNVETSRNLKFVDWVFGNTFFSANYPVDQISTEAFATIAPANIQCLNLIKYGNQSYAKVTNRIFMDRLDLNYSWVSNPASNFVDPIPARVVVIYFKDIRLPVYPVVTDLLNAVFPNGTFSDLAFSAGLHPNLVGQAEVLYDERFILQAPTPLGAGNATSFGSTSLENYRIMKSINLKGAEAVYRMQDGGTVGQIADIQRGAIVIINISDLAVPVTWGLMGSSRLWFCEGLRGVKDNYN